MTNEEHAALERAFNLETQQAMLKEDAQAWASVTGILFTIVTLGLLFGIAAVLIAI